MLLGFKPTTSIPSPLSHITIPEHLTCSSDSLIPHFFLTSFFFLSLVSHLHTLCTISTPPVELQRPQQQPAVKDSLHPTLWTEGQAHKLCCPQGQGQGRQWHYDRTHWEDHRRREREVPLQVRMIDRSLCLDEYCRIFLLSFFFGGVIMFVIYSQRFTISV